ncbi:MAG: M18 family aminopeptidase [Eubacterium sp.]|nr:M18 family aminopeptidase [Eubacterium sp.]
MNENIIENEINNDAKTLLNLIDKSPTAFHVIENAKEILDLAGYKMLKETEVWNLQVGEKYYVSRNDSSLIAFSIPKPDYKGIRIIASHSDSPCPKLKEDFEYSKDGYVRLDVEKYGGMLLAPWLDRPLSIAGRIIVRDDDGIRPILVNLDKDVAVIPSLAIHMNKEANSGYSYSFQKDMLPIVSTSDGKKGIMSLVAEAAGVEEDSILGKDLFMYIRENGVIWGSDDEFIGSSRLDDQECVWCSLKGFVEAENNEYVKMLCIFDNEEVGSRTKQGADSNFLYSLIDRINDNLERSREEYYTAYANSFMISADNAHALHPAHTNKYDPVQSPKMNEGIVIKFSARQSYTTDGVSAAYVKQICEDNNIPYQVFVNHSDEPGGSTLGNISNSHVSIDTADIGLAQLAMHSSYEVAGIKDTQYLKEFSKAFYER